MNESDLWELSIEWEVDFNNHKIPQLIFPLIFFLLGETLEG